MKISKLINALQIIYEAHGDVIAETVDLEAFSAREIEDVHYYLNSGLAYIEVK